MAVISLASATKPILGIYESAGTEGRIRPADRRLKDDILVDPRDVGDAKPGDMVLAESLPGRRLGPRHARIVERLGPADGPNVVSLISIVENDIPTEFPPAAIKEAKAPGPAPPLQGARPATASARAAHASAPPRTCNCCPPCPRRCERPTARTPG